MSTKEQVLALCLGVHNPELAKQEGHVSQVWEDGEHTSQKGGSLLGQRTLHTFAAGGAHPELTAFLLEHFPCKNSSGHAYVFCTSTEADYLNQEIRRWVPEVALPLTHDKLDCYQEGWALAKQCGVEAQAQMDKLFQKLISDARGSIKP